ncbi:hypothetical protein F2Q70_00027105 [Brassica cretica]|uniref:Uncharacterized protein n=1 Tax=Brassica cretica TaxID=69181 RepID=A0A8S9LDE1_BRACR|nr:hypothetical protein F2Q70_00027105 [Brassica cretica]
MISWGRSNNTTNETKSQTEGKIRFEISVAIRTLENPDEATPPPRVTQYNPNTNPPCKMKLMVKKINLHLFVLVGDKDEEQEV